MTRSGKRPPCRVCGSRHYRKNHLGFYICDQGHQLEHYVQEESEITDGLATTHKRRVVKDPTLSKQYQASLQPKGKLKMY
jgi:hypothetical protein